jgi:hypothetical protein
VADICNDTGASGGAICKPDSSSLYWSQTIHSLLEPPLVPNVSQGPFNIALSQYWGPSLQLGVTSVSQGPFIIALSQSLINQFHEACIMHQDSINWSE